jgi:hypothetical protein
MDYYELMKWEKQQNLDSAATPTNLPDDDFVIASGAKLKVDDIVNNYEYLNPVREYMIERKGIDYKDKSAEEVVDDFVKHMRYFNANTVSTAGEVRFVSKADDLRKNKAKKAYQIYDSLGNVFVNDGVMGAVSGIGDYVFAAAKDPTNYLGLITGGVGRAGAAGVSITGKQMIKNAVVAAGRESLKSGADRQAARLAAARAGREAAKRVVEQGMSKKQAAGVYRSTREQVMKEGRQALARQAMKRKQQELFETAATRSLKQTVALDSGAAVLQDVMAQTAEMRAGSQEQYSLMQTGFSSLLGGVAGGAQLVFGKARGGSGLAEDIDTDPLTKIADKAIELNVPTFDKSETDKIAKETFGIVRTWNEKVEAGEKYDAAMMPAQLIKEIMLGSDGTGKTNGIAKIYADKGFKITREKHLSDVMTNVFRFMEQDQLDMINKEMAKHAGFHFGELSASRLQVGDIVSAKISEFGRGLNVMSQVRRVLDSGIVAAQQSMAKTIDEVEAKAKIQEDADKAVKEGGKVKQTDKVQYFQSLWKRLLVSSPATTALNVAGYTQFAAGQTLADIFNSATLMGIGARQKIMGNSEAASESFRMGRAYTAIIAQRARNLLDPYTTHDAYMKFLDENQDVSKVLFETMAGGIDAQALRYGIDPNDRSFRTLEAVARASNQITGVRIQDSFTKSQMFMSELDKYLRLEKQVTLKEALLMDENVIDETILNGALDTTLKSVFAKDYTVHDSELIRKAAGIVETVSNTPGLGTILPFGRFMNNVVATAYQWSPFAAMSLIKPFGRKILKDEGMDVAERDILARAFVGSAALALAADYDKGRREQGLGVYDVDVGGGTIVDAKNTYPFSLFLATGRAFNMMRNGEEVPKELKMEALNQLAVGQVAKDLQFGNDLMNIMDILMNQDEGARAATFDAFYKSVGNFAAGFTRPLDAVNKAIGFAMGTDTVKDVRQAEGMNILTQTATKYIDNIFEAFIDKTDTITGEDLKVATREGELYDANPFARIFGITVKPGRTASEKAYSMSEMQPWTANERTNVPAYDKAFNGLLAPMLEYQTQRVINTDAFKNADLSGRRKILRTMVTQMKSEVKDRMAKGYTGGENARLRLAAKADSRGSKEIRNEAMRMMKERYGVTGTVKDFDYQELEIFIEFVDYLNEMYTEVAKI